MPFRGMISEEISESIKTLGFRHYLVAWLPTWWLTLATSMTMAGVSMGCALWAIVDGANGLPIATPILTGASMVIGAIAGLVVPITLAWFKDRSEQRTQENLKVRLKELELQVEINRVGHTENAENIQRMTVTTQKIADAAEKMVEVKQEILRTHATSTDNDKRF